MKSASLSEKEIPRSLGLWLSLKVFWAAYTGRSVVCNAQIQADGNIRISERAVVMQNLVHENITVNGIPLSEMDLTMKPDKDD